MQRRHLSILAALGIAGGALYAYRAFTSDAEGGDSNPWLAPPAPGTITPEADQVNSADATPDQRIAAGLALIRKFESGNRYDVLYGGATFDSFNQHPNVRVPFHNPKTGKDDYSTAAGAYQINHPTWVSEIQPALGLVSFTPADQDAAAVWLLQKDGAYDPLSSGDIDTFLRRASKRWASLPYSTAQQHPQALQAALDTFTDFLSSVA
jgi:muramidase (phage lysozyme)